MAETYKVVDLCEVEEIREFLFVLVGESVRQDGFKTLSDVVFSDGLALLLGCFEWLGEEI